MSFPRYPQYARSQYYWLGEIPSHWSVVKLRYLTECLDGRRVPLNSSARAERQGEVPYWGANCIVDYLDEALFDEDLVLLGEDGAPFFEATRPVAFYSSGRIWPNNHVHVLRPRVQGSAQFIAYALNATDYAPFIEGSTRDKLTQSAMNSIPLPWPPEHDREVIVSVLDRETAKIDALIAEQQRLMELLQEKRQAVIAHAVTKGLNPDAPMKPSGVEWLGDVPAHWELVKGARIGTLFGSEPVAEEQVVDDGTLPYIKVGSLSQDSFDVESWTWFVSPEVEAHVTSRSNYVVFPKRGAAIFTNKVNIVRVESLIDPNLMGWQINERARTDYVAFALKARGWTELADVSTVPQINNKHIAPQLFPLPPVSEQDAIVEHLTLEWSRIDALALDAKRAVDLLSERRAALISAAVTGQIDVRGFVEREVA